jgi:cell division protein FtsL
MSAVAQAPAPAKTRPKKPDRAPARAPFAGGVAWILVTGVLLAGIVALNVLVLQMNMQFDGLSRERAQLRGDNALLRSQLSSASSHLRIEDAAKATLGLKEADGLTTTYVRLGAK